MNNAIDTYERNKTEERKLLMGMPEHLGDYLFGGCQKINKANRVSKLSPENRPRVKLASVKTDLYNPVQSTLRRYDIDDVQGKLSDEHSRSTIPPEITSLPKSKKSKFMPPQIIYPGFDLLPLLHCKWYQEKSVEELSFLRNKNLSDSWNNFIHDIPLSDTRIVLPKNRDFHFHNYVVKYIKNDDLVSKPTYKVKFD
ncbi:uncharacterized protein LOC126894083 [Daktulosphaira vitifoliae]|uniref:uncharacterized protein LOC126894083 n=1 Tax=Daktulosphaira vitifoliae TaxID=58002 RepID=UPI0021AAF05C|nr:uncharacterized protein LOC126894083 [Daktulosphaira vitifoliae]